MIKDARIRKVGVIGAGVMGAGIAAQAANGGTEVVLLDILPDGAGDRNAMAQGALDRLIGAGSSGGLMHPSLASRIQVGNLEDDINALASCDWIIEVVIERLDVKQTLYRKLAEIRRPDAIVSSNTSTIPLARLLEGLPDEFRRHFVVTHYFNPPRHMRLMELVTGSDTAEDVIERVTEFNDRCMGKTVVRCADRPGFIGNRIGVFWMQVALQEAVAHGLTVEEADAIMRVCGFPKTGVFGLWDLVGIDLMSAAVESLRTLLPPDDDFSAVSEISGTVQGMLEKGYKGRKGSILQGFYRQRKDADGRRVREVIDLDSLQYRAPGDVSIASAALKAGQLADLVLADDRGGRFAWRVLSRVLNYAAKLIPEAADSPRDFDLAMKLGYNWTWGPFEMIDRLGLDAFSRRLREEGVAPASFLNHARGRPIFMKDGEQMRVLDAEGEYQTRERAAGTLQLQDLAAGARLHQRSRSTLWDLGDDVWCLEFNGKVPTIGLELLDDIQLTLNEAVAADKALVFYHEGPVFAAGADLRIVLETARTPAAAARFIQTGQDVFKQIQQAQVPVVGAPLGAALAGGLELLLHCHAIQAHADASMGLVEVQVGIVPGWGGCRELLKRCAERFGTENAIVQCFELLRTSAVAASAQEARALGFLRDSDGISMNVGRVLFDAKQKALALRQSPSHRSCAPVMAVPNDLQLASGGYQRELEEALLSVLMSATEPDWERGMSDREREVDLALFARVEARERIAHMLAHGKPLMN
ncbi:enoyl-CoA hydratase/isomerase family protein [Azoarcus sp. L1K30]|uniref:3-hydroxyacyl-CoA dehydrogenase/enoyl-CoA hydratase family protein n=1 Tax=Azoarcus sp. L1K30 TaxID=2820277 RepID=UPI001B826DD5|nr:3-hydroxyacyl-CoA dehydrogenase/enoyl-CoA hydratase family protein [Azoarcus sp. L1K30]MBR0568907.1 enoyl-CoA hydratase/isomerase family protein [Azoarcus sp. L1K30]